MEDENVNYSFRTLEQAVAYTLTPSDIVVTYRKGLSRTVQRVPLNVLRIRQSTWETTNNGWVVLVAVCLLAVGFGTWGLIDPKSTGMYTVVALGLVAVGVIMPYILWDHRKLRGVTFTGEADFSLSVIAHAAPTEAFHSFVNSLESRIGIEPNSQ